MNYLVSLCFALFLFLPICLLAGAVLDLAYTRLVVIARRQHRTHRRGNPWFDL